MVVEAPLLPHHCFSTLSDNYSYNTWQPVALNMGYICKNILSFEFQKKKKNRTFFLPYTKYSSS